ncbi:MAG: hypothetical protein FGO69_10390 [Methanobacterium sp.]|nr:MAG: hypothetical protein FGO69_10390 [Methanobacterium sp.]
MFGKFHIFYGEELSVYLEEKDRRIQHEIENEPENYILNINKTDYITHLSDSNKINIPYLDFDNITVSGSEKEIPAEYFPQGFMVRRGETYKKPIITYHIPFQGENQLLRYRPNPTLISGTTDVYIEDGYVCFDVINFRDDTEEIKREADSTIGVIKRQGKYWQKQLEEYNNNLPSKIGRIFDIQKQKFLNKHETLSGLGVPIKKTGNLPETYSIPTPEIRKSVRPTVTETGFTPEPTLDETTYNEILQTIFDLGKVFERYPSTYKDKSEEDLRDHILLYLEPRFEGSTTGETFNKTGKTDILIRHENTNVFIAECKFWRGRKSYLDSITQLFKYLTWRDSKVAVVIFVDNKNISTVLETVKEVTPEHPNYLGFINEKYDSWFNFRFHINDDRNREVRLAVLLIHIPK